MTDTSKEAADNQNALVKALKDFNREWANDDVLTYSPVPSAPGYTTGMAGVYMGEAADFIAALLSERDALRSQLQAAREGGAVEYVCPDDETALNYLDATYGNDMRCAVSCMIDALRALKFTSAEGEG
ncbi:hypothetical protein [Phaeobacter italicus]|jgi:hypothetical protein|uniref:hypothetical protein n=1 Tax=Phaeobacter italicus TaxID=481446 RepID=UPI002FDDF863